MPFKFFDTATQNIFEGNFNSFELIFEKYNDINLMHCFRKGNGRTRRICINLALEKQLETYTKFCKIAKDNYKIWNKILKK